MNYLPDRKAVVVCTEIQDTSWQHKDDEDGHK